MTPRVVLVLGGARSGKSAWAEAVAREYSGQVLFLATAIPSDEEMAARIAAHRMARPNGWRTIEEPLDLGFAIRSHVHPGDLVLLDCLTVWLGNLMLDHCGGDPDAAGSAVWGEVEASALSAVAGVIAATREADASLLVVSNEVGMGLVPPYPLGRAYRDILGRVNGFAAAAADSVILMVAGIPVDLAKLRADTPFSALGDAQSN